MFKCAMIMLLALAAPTAAAWAQYSNKQIDSFINIVSTALRQNGQWKEAVGLFEKMIPASRQNNYQKAVIDCYINLGNLNYMLGNSTSSILYLDTALTELNGIQNKGLEVRILSELGKNYLHLGKHDKALEYFDKGVVIASAIKDEEVKKRQLQYIYAMQASVYENSNNISQYYQALEKAYQLLPNPLLASRMTKYFLLYNKNLDSARNYIEIANKMWETGSYPLHQRSIMLRNEALYNVIIEDYTKAEILYKESIVISQKLGNKEEERGTYQQLAKLHGKMKNKEGQDSALNHVSNITDTLQKDVALAVKLPAVAKPLESFSVQQKEEKKRSGIWLLLAASFAIELITLLYYFRRRSRKTKS
ncbi:MAG: hypothetical protein EOP51_16140 [Sphingobacteriales bacterium]|nr:MAG: hypothetical protein EOP51_16140 [Sphingobacteriales bacterium]